MKARYILSTILFLMFGWGFQSLAQSPANSKTRPSMMVENAQRTGATFENASFFEIEGTESTVSSDPVLRKALTKGTVLSLKQQAINGFMQKPAATINLDIPTHEGTKTLKLVQARVFEEGMLIRTSTQGNQSVPMGLHYRGIVEGHTNSLVAISIFGDQISGFFSSDELQGNYVLGKIEGETSNKHIVYHEPDLKEPLAFGCLTEDNGEGYKPSQLLPVPTAERVGDCVRVYVEADYNVYTANGSSTANTTAYLNGLFNQAIAIYSNESIEMVISEIFIHTSATGYSGSAGTIRSAWQANNNGPINGDLIHFIHWQSSGGSGIAASAGVSTLCKSDVDDRVCITKTSLSYSTVPTYSRAVKVVTHEMGHLLGSYHTHRCVWNGDNTTIDDYGNVSPGNPGVVLSNAEGKSCFVAPGKTNSATYTPTIMSYYDSYQWGTFSMGNGFGSQPGNVIRNSVVAATCLSPCCDAPVAKCKNITRNLSPGGTVTISTSDVDNGSTADCGGGSTTLSKYTFNCGNVGDNNVTLTQTEQYYRESTCVAKVTINDVTAPQAKCKNVTVYLDAFGNVSLSGAQIDNGSNDACGIASLTASPSVFDCSTIGAQSAVLTVTDNNNLTASCQAGVYVDDTAAKPPKLSKQNCNNCNQLRIWYCQFDPAPASLNEFINGSVELNDTYVPGNPLYWFNDAGGSQGAPYAGTGAQPPTPNMNNAVQTKYYWIAQINQISGCLGDAIRVRVRVRKSPILTFSTPPLPFCLNGQVDLAEWVSDANEVTDQYDFYDADPDLPGANLLGSVTATKGNVDPLMYVVETPQVGNNTYWAVAINKGNNNSITCTAKASMTIPVASPANLDPIPNMTVDNGDAVNVPFVSNDASFIVWVDHVSFNNPNIGLVGGIGLGPNLTFTAQNNGPDPITAMIRVIAYKGNCAGQVRDFFITVNPAPLRQTMTHSLTLAAYKLNVHDVRLEWDIVYDEKLSHFEIEKLKEGVAYTDDVSMLVNADNWEKLGTVAYGAAKSSYSYTDKEGMSNVTKYRIKLIHEDGSAIWSNVVEIQFDFYDGDRFVIYPNPSDGVFQLKSILPITSEWTYQVSDAMGRIVQSGMLTETDQQFDLQTQATGVYYLILRNQEGMRYLKRVVKK